MAEVRMSQPPDQSEPEPHSPTQHLRPVTTVPRVLSLTAVTVLLAGGVPFFIGLLLSLIPQSTLSEDAPFALNGFIFMVVLLVVPVILGATFCWASFRFRTARFPRIWGETALLAGGIVCLGPLLGMLAQAVGVSFGVYVPLTNLSFAVESPHPPFALAWIQWRLIETAWLPIWFIQIGLAIGLGGLGTGLAQGLARWSLVRGAPVLLPRQPRRRLAVQVIGSVAVMLVGSNLVLAPIVLLVADLDISPLYVPLAAILSVFLIPSAMLSVMAGVQTWRLRHLVPPGTVSSTPIPPWGPDDQAEFSIESL